MQRHIQVSVAALTAAAILAFAGQAQGAILVSGHSTFDLEITTPTGWTEFSTSSASANTSATLGAVTDANDDPVGGGTDIGPRWTDAFVTGSGENYSAACARSVSDDTYGYAFEGGICSFVGLDGLTNESGASEGHAYLELYLQTNGSDQGLLAFDWLYLVEALINVGPGDVANASASADYEISVELFNPVGLLNANGLAVCSDSGQLSASAGDSHEDGDSYTCLLGTPSVNDQFRVQVWLNGSAEASFTACEGPDCDIEPPPPPNGAPEPGTLALLGLGLAGLAATRRRKT